MSSVFGNTFKVSTYGESHGKAIGCIIDHVPSNIPLCEDDFKKAMALRRPSDNVFSTTRKEDDNVLILSGVFEGKTTGTPISLIVYNNDAHSSDYNAIKDLFRPSHADYTYDCKYNIRDYRGGGRSSGRETVARVAAGVVAEKILSAIGTTVISYTSSIGCIESPLTDIDFSFATSTRMPDKEADRLAKEYMEEISQNADSVGGTITTVIKGLPKGIGEPVFDKLDAVLAHAIMSIGAVKAIEFGDGILGSRSLGSEFNDMMSKDCENLFMTNHNGGILGGISNGNDITIKAFVKPTPSIGKSQETVDKDLNNVSVNIPGRHDVCIVPRCVEVVKSMVSIALTDMIFENMSSDINNVIKLYR